MQKGGPWAITIKSQLHSFPNLLRFILHSTSPPATLPPTLKDSTLIKGHLPSCVPQLLNARFFKPRILILESHIWGEEKKTPFLKSSPVRFLEQGLGDVCAESDPPEQSREGWQYVPLFRESQCEVLESRVASTGEGLATSRSGGTAAAALGIGSPDALRPLQEPSLLSFPHRHENTYKVI